MRWGLTLESCFLNHMPDSVVALTQMHGQKEVAEGGSVKEDVLEGEEEIS